MVQKAGRQNGGHVDRRVGQAVADGRNGGTGVEERAREIFSTVRRALTLNGLARNDAPALLLHPDPSLRVESSNSKSRFP